MPGIPASAWTLPVDGIENGLNLIGSGSVKVIGNVNVIGRPDVTGSSDMTGSVDHIGSFEMIGSVNVDIVLKHGKLKRMKNLVSD